MGFVVVVVFVLQRVVEKVCVVDLQVGFCCVEFEDVVVFWCFELSDWLQCGIVFVLFVEDLIVIEVVVVVNLFVVCVDVLFQMFVVMKVEGCFGDGGEFVCWNLVFVEWSEVFGVDV